ncbi:hypothetical protein DRQ53_01140 [bacterium]|nr:MAG: hypothetical protein DRQ53_01140 [bacterium]
MRNAISIALFVLVAATGTAWADTPERNAADRLEEALSQPGVATSIMIGRALLESGDAAGALPYYLNAWQADPTSRQTGIRLAEVAVLAGQTAMAVEVLDSLWVADPEDVPVGARLARLRFALGDVEGAMTVTAELEASSPEHPDVVELRLDLAQMQGDYEEALASLDRLLESEGENARLLTRRGVLLMALGREQEAEQAWRRALDLEPGSVNASGELTDLLIRQGRKEELMLELQRLIDEDLATPRQRAALADLYLSDGSLDDAAEILIPMASAGDLDKAGELLLVQLLGDLSRQDEALALLAQMEEEQPDRAGLKSVRGALLLDNREFDAAEEALQAALELDPDDNDARVTLLLVHTGRDPRLFAPDREPDPVFVALVEESAAAADPRSLRQQFLVGAMLRRLQRPEESASFLQRAAALPGSSEQVLYELAVAQQEAGQGRAAAGTLEQLLKRAPDTPDYLNFYGYLLAEEGRELERAQAMIEQALEIDPENGAYIDSLGWVYYQRGDLDRALQELIRAVNLVGDDPIVLEHLGDCLRDLGQHEQARRTYERALAAGAEAERMRLRIEGLQVGDAP